jgi:hypothetical protein
MVQGWHDISTKHTSGYLARYEVILKRPQRLTNARRIKHYNTVKVVWLWFGADKTPCDENMRFTIPARAAWSSSFSSCTKRRNRRSDHWKITNLSLNSSSVA